MQPQPEDQSAWFNQLAGSLDEQRQRLAPLWHMTPGERLAAFHRGEMTHEQMFAWAARHPGEVPTLNGEFLFIAASCPENGVRCPLCGDDEVMLACDGTLQPHPDFRAAYNPDLGARQPRVICRASNLTLEAARQIVAAKHDTTVNEPTGDALAA